VAADVSNPEHVWCVFFVFSSPLCLAERVDIASDRLTNFSLRLYSSSAGSVNGNW